MEIIKDVKDLKPLTDSSGSGGDGRPPWRPGGTVGDADIPKDFWDSIYNINSRPYGRKNHFAVGMNHGRGSGPGPYYNPLYGAPQGGVGALQKYLGSALDPDKALKPLPQVPDYSDKKDYKEGPPKPPTKKKV